MNCLEFRRVALADPGKLGEAAREHAAACPGCTDFLERTRELDARLAETLRVPVPEGLADRILLGERVRRPRRQWLYALAAGLFLGLGIGTLVFFQRPDPAPALAAINHVADEEVQEILDHGRSDDGALAQALARLRVSLPAELGEVRYAGTCPFGGGTAYHIVLATPLGKATLLLMPERPLESRVVASGRGFSAVAAPVRGGGYAIVADSTRSIERIESLLRLRQ